MRILDSNIIIYAIQPQFKFLRKMVENSDNYTSIVSKIEVLGFKELTQKDRFFLESAFNILNVISLSDEVAQRAVALKQQKKMSLGDSIVAATALVYDLELVTRNFDDFKGVKGLKLFNPFK